MSDDKQEDAPKSGEGLDVPKGRMRASSRASLAGTPGVRSRAGSVKEAVLEDVEELKHVFDEEQPVHHLERRVQFEKLVLYLLLLIMCVVAFCLTVDIIIDAADLNDTDDKSKSGIFFWSVMFITGLFGLFMGAFQVALNMKQECTPELPVSIGIVEGWLAILFALLVLAASITFVASDAIDEEDKYMASCILGFVSSAALLGIAALALHEAHTPDVPVPVDHQNGTQMTQKKATEQPRPIQAASQQEKAALERKITSAV